jgi:sugar/nucleoside kinase (ribokinase family)
MNSTEWIPAGRRLIVGVGSALVDILTHEKDEFVHQTGAPKGGMIYVDKAYIDRTLARSLNTPTVVPGGSACNTVVGIGMLGGKARFVGKCGNGTMGEFFVNDLRRRGVEPDLMRSDSPTGRVLSIITPDAQRSMFTFLGASAETHPREIAAANFENAAIAHIEGYLAFNPDLLRKVAAAAKDSGAVVSLDLASFTVVEHSGPLLREIVKDFVDILLANEDEAQAYTGSSEDMAALESLAKDVKIAVLKKGPGGSLIAQDGEVVRSAALGDGHAVDTTGAGDLWAAGFLHGLVNDRPLDVCGKMGSVCGYEVCQVVGASIPASGWERIRKQFRKWEPAPDGTP